MMMKTTTITRNTALLQHPLRDPYVSPPPLSQPPALPEHERGTHPSNP